MGWLARRTTTPTTLAALVLVLFAAVLACAILCGKLLGLAEHPDGSIPFDSSITSWMVGHRTHGLTTLARLLSTLGSQAVLSPLSGVVALALLVRRRLVLAAVLLCAWGGAILLYNLTKAVVQRPRPPSSIWLTNVGHTTSFPSGHATQSLSTYLALALVAATWLAKPSWVARVPALILAAGIGSSRVYLGVHWTTDVLAGWLIALSWFAGVMWLGGRAAPKGPGGAPVGADDQAGAR